MTTTTTTTKTRPRENAGPKITWAKQSTKPVSYHGATTSFNAPGVRVVISRYRGRYQNKPRNFWKLEVQGTVKGKFLSFEGRYLHLQIAKRRANALLRGGPVKKAWKGKEK